MQLEPTLVICAVAGGRRKFPLLSQQIPTIPTKGGGYDTNTRKVADMIDTTLVIMTTP
jgi:hypothetical protein